MYINIKLSSPISLLAKGFPMKREKLMQIMMKKLLNFFFLFYLWQCVFAVYFGCTFLSVKYHMKC